MCKKCRKFFSDDFCDFDGNFQMLQDKEHNPNQFCYRCLDTFMRGSLEDKQDGVFYCPVCNVRTNQKTYTTKCSRCKGDLQRIANTNKEK